MPPNPFKPTQAAPRQGMALQPPRWLRLLLPSSCALCGVVSDDALCADCEKRYLGKVSSRCMQCGMAFAATHDARCGACLRQAPAFDATITAADYAAPIDQLALALKFAGRLELARLLARLLHDAANTPTRRDLPRPDLLTAIPLGPQRLIERGFNQALEIAKPLAHTWGIPLAANLLIRQRETKAQSLLHPDERSKNMRGALTVSMAMRDMIQGRHIGVVDDVMTTGATLEEAAAVLKRHGAARVTNFVFARTLSS